MEHIRLNDLTPLTNKRGVQMKSVLNHEDATVKNLMLGEGESIPPHQVTVKVFFYIIFGEGTLKVGDQSVTVKAHEVVTCPENTPMSVHADKGSALTFLNVKTPGIE